MNLLEQYKKERMAIRFNGKAMNKEKFTADELEYFMNHHEGQTPEAYRQKEISRRDDRAKLNR